MARLEEPTILNCETACAHLAAAERYIELAQDAVIGRQLGDVAAYLVLALHQLRSGWAFYRAVNQHRYRSKTR